MQDDLLARIFSVKDWRHPYEINGRKVKLSSKRFAEWHPWRWSVDLPVLKEALGTFEGKQVLDVGCNDGWYGFQAEKEGARVSGIDGRRDAIERAELIKDAIESKATFRCADIEGPEPLSGRYDATLFYGLLYHLADPIRVLSRIGQVTSRVVAVQTFVHVSDNEPRLYLFEEDTRLPGAALYGLITRPTQSALMKMLKAAGFDYVYRSYPEGSPKRDTDWQWAFFYGVKGAPLASLPTL